MSNKTIITKNSILTTRLLEYLAANPDSIKDIPTGVSYVSFSATDNELNKFNEGLLKSLIKEGKKVIKAEETLNKREPWKFTSI